MMEYDIHTLLDALTLVATTAVIYALTATPIKNTYQNDLDSVRWYYVVSAVGDRGACRMKVCMCRGGNRSSRDVFLAAAEAGAHAVGATQGGSCPLSCFFLCAGVQTHVGCAACPTLLPQVVPCAVLATFAHPFTSHLLVFRVSSRVPLGTSLTQSTP
jgi:hypothetical protein